MPPPDVISVRTSVLIVASGLHRDKEFVAAYGWPQRARGQETRSDTFGADARTKDHRPSTQRRGHRHRPPPKSKPPNKHSCRTSTAAEQAPRPNKHWAETSTGPNKHCGESQQVPGAADRTRPGAADPNEPQRRPPTHGAGHPQPDVPNSGHRTRGGAARRRSWNGPSGPCRHAVSGEQRRGCAAALRVTDSSA